MAERYLITYADLITLLLGLFIVLYSMSEQSMSKFRSYSAAFNLVFGQGGGSGVPIGLDAMLVGQHPKPGFRQGRTGGKGEGDGDGEGGGKEQMAELKGIQGEKGEEKFQIRESREGIVISLPERLTFSSGYADLQPGARAVLDSLSVIFEKYDNKLRIEGHTDNIPMRGTYPHNMALSNARASNAYTYLVEELGLDPQRISTSGYGEYRPFAPNDSPENRAKNRRTDIIVVKKEASATNGEEPEF